MGQATGSGVSLPGRVALAGYWTSLTFALPFCSVGTGNVLAHSSEDLVDDGAGQYLTLGKGSKSSSVDRDGVLAR